MTTARKFLDDSSLFRKIYIIDLFCCMLSFVQVLAYVMLPFLFIWGLRLVYFNQRRYDTFFKLRFGLWVGAFIAFSFLAIIFNFSITVIISVVMFLHVCICFFVFYGMHTEPKFNFKEELYSLACFMVYTTTILNAVGFFCLLFGIHFDFEFYDLYWIRYPLYENRFTGVFFNPNLLGFVSVVGLVCCHILRKDGLYADTGKPRIRRAWLIASGLANLFALILCDSNAAFVLALGYALLYVVYLFFDERRSRMSPSKVFIKVITLIITCAVIAASSMAFRIVFKAGFAVINARTNAFVDILFNDEELMKELEDEAEEDENGEASFEHENKNLDSGRFKMWKESVGLFKISPIIGIANGNIVFYSGEYLNGALKYNYNNNDLHNGFLTIIVSTGLIGGLLFGTFGFRVAKHAAQHLFLRRKTYRNDVYPCLFSFLGAYIVYACFEKALLYDISFMVMWFWLFLGYISCYIIKFEPSLQSQYLFNRKRLTRTML